jgi:hypothetical protein
MARLTDKEFAMLSELGALKAFCPKCMHTEFTRKLSVWGNLLEILSLFLPLPLPRVSWVCKSCGHRLKQEHSA